MNKYSSLLRHYLIIIGLFISLLFTSANSVLAFDASKIGIHILNIEELEDARRLVPESSSSYVTIPFTLADLEKKEHWQSFFDSARELNVIPLVRLTTTYSSERNAWEVPTKKNIVDQITFLSSLNWPTDKKHIIIFNEVNHAKEWGGKVDPNSYAEVLEFASQWAHTEEENYVVLPAAMDLAAPNSLITREAFSYLSALLEYSPTVFDHVDVWNSHSYPNPGFSSSPLRNGKNSLRGFTYELNYLKEKTGRDFNVMITETGWQESPQVTRWLTDYYTYAFQHIWSDDRVLAVTPFILKGSPGPFTGFSFLDAQNNPTNQYYAFTNALQKVTQNTDHVLVGLR